MAKFLVSFHLMVVGLFGAYLGPSSPSPVADTAIPVCHTVAAVDFTFPQAGMKPFALDPALQALQAGTLMMGTQDTRSRTFE